MLELLSTSNSLTSKRISLDVLTSRHPCPTLAAMRDRDHVDRFLDGIREELPANIDLVVEGMVARISGISGRLRRRLEGTLEPYGLTNGDYKVISALRWAGKP